MAHKSDSYADRFRKAVVAGMATQYVLDVIDGKEDADPERLKTAKWAIDKCVANPPASVITHESARPPDFTIIHGDD